MNGEQIVAWRGPTPARVDAAAVRLRADRLEAHGASTTPEYVTDYRLVTGPAWVTRRLAVRTRGEGWARGLTLERAPDGRWSAAWTAEGSAADGGPDPVLPDLKGALDCDLGLCPLTNTMPVLRHDLLVRARAGDTMPVDLVMAWVSVPDLAVHVSRQTYAAEHPLEPGGAVVRFASGGTATWIELDGDGLVVSYPGIGRRVT